MSQIERIKQAIMADSQNASYTERGIEPLFAAPKTARINIIGQAPGLKTQEAGLYWNLLQFRLFCCFAYGFLLSRTWQVG